MKIKLLLITLTMFPLLSCSLASIVEMIASEEMSAEVSDVEIFTATMEIVDIYPQETIEALVPSHITASTDTTASSETVAPAANRVPPGAPSTLIDAADAALWALHDQDLDALSRLVHPVMGVRFTPLAYIEQSQLVFLPDELPGLFNADTDFVWGYDHMSGHPFKHTFSEYYDRFIFHVDYTEAEEIGINKEVHSGHQINNIHEFYPSSQFVEYHFSWDAFPDLFTWKSLRLVFIEENGAWWLIGIVNDEWGG
jgi:hypothetical protein